MASLDQLLTAYTVGANDTSVYGALLGVGFQVYNETGMYRLPSGSIMAF